MERNCDDVFVWDAIEELGDDGGSRAVPLWLFRHQATNHVELMGRPCRVLEAETTEWVHFMENAT